MIEAIVPNVNTNETNPKPVSDAVSHPAHYTYGNIETIDYIDSCGYGLDMCLGNAMKYISRCKHKNNLVQDIRKAIWYLSHAAEKLESGEYKVG